MESVVQIISKGGVVVFPTSTLYGLGADARNPKAVGRIYQLKGREFNKPILVLVKDSAELHKIVRDVPPTASTLIKAFWPGGLTIVFRAKETLPAILTAHTGKIGVRIPKHPVAHALVRAFNGALTGTSANVSGDPGCSSISELDNQVTGQVDGILDAGPLMGGRGSTVVDVTTEVPVILREGAIPQKDIFSVLKI
jgi:L-threonylcarbamoyladenylate synthase